MKDPVDENEPQSTPPATSERRWWFRWLAIACAVLPFAIGEAYLRCRDSGTPTDLSNDPIFDTRKLSPLFVKTETGRHWEIPESRRNFFCRDSFPIEKAPRDRRVFVLGGSTVQGRPYAIETAFSSWLQLQLQAKDPEHHYDVINCGGVSYASYRVAIVLDEVLQHDPDAIVLYTGHNEFLEERSYPAHFHSRGMVDGIAQRLRLVSALQGLWSQPIARQTLSGEVVTRLDLVQGMERYRRDPNWRAGVVEHFGRNLRRMIEACARADVPLVVCVPASDSVRTPPIKIAMAELDEDQRRAFDDNWTDAINQQHGDRQRIDACRRCFQIDPGHAGAHFVAATLLRATGDSDTAKRHFLAARDADVCPLRATSEILRQIEMSTRDRRSVSVVRCNALLDRSNLFDEPIPDDLEDPTLFVDHIHPTIAGHQIIAEHVAASLETFFRITPDSQWQSRYQESVKDHLATLDETYYARGKQRLEGLLNWAAGRAGKLQLN